MGGEEGRGKGECGEGQLTLKSFENPYETYYRSPKGKIYMKGI